MDLASGLRSLGRLGLVGHLLSARQFSECLAAHSAACCLVVKPLITSVSPSGQRISTTQPSPGGLPFLTPKTGRCSDIQRICAYGGPVQASHPATIKLTHYPAIAALECAILGATPSSSVLCAMELADYLRDQAVMYRKLAEQADDPVVKNEMLELASVCEEVANNIEDHLTGG